MSGHRTVFSQLLWLAPCRILHIVCVHHTVNLKDEKWPPKPADCILLVPNHCGPSTVCCDPLTSWKQLPRACITSQLWVWRPGWGSCFPYSSDYWAWNRGFPSFCVPRVGVQLIEHVMPYFISVEICLICRDVLCCLLGYTLKWFWELCFYGDREDIGHNNHQLYW